MTKDIYISIKSIQSSPDGDLTQKVGPFKGQYFHKDGFHYCLYEEIMEGVEHPVKTRIKFSENLVVLHKSGDVSFDATYEVGKDYISNYNTMFGPITIKTVTKQISLKDTSSLLTLKLRYDSIMADNYTTDMNMEITIQNA